MNDAEKYHAGAVVDVIREMENQGFTKITFLEHGFEVCHELA
jgi:hypothetical protein